MRYTGILFLITCAPLVWSQPVQLDAAVSDPSSLIGLTLDGLVSRFGLPQSVHAVRGIETWQDDVVFVYEDQGFYVYRNRVWQIEIKTAYGIRIGDPFGRVSQLLDGALYFDTYLLYTLPSRDWPITLRVNFDQSQAVSTIFIYRSDF